MREVRRHRAQSAGTYRPQFADWYARSRGARNTQFTRADGVRVEALVRGAGAPNSAGWLRRHRVLGISHETISRYLWEDSDRAGGALPISGVLGSSAASATGPLSNGDKAPFSLVGLDV